jgi:recombination protein RecA
MANKRAILASRHLMTKATIHCSHAQEDYLQIKSTYVKECEMPINPEKEKALAAAMSQIDRRFGKGSIMKMGEANTRLAIETVPTGSIALDLALGGGIPRGRITEIYGPESSGKTTLSQHIIAEVQRMGGVAAFIDAEHAFDPIYAAACGVNIDELLVSQPDTGEQALEICETLVRSGAVDIVIVDSVAALVPRAEIEGDMGDSLPGLQARLMSQALRKLSGAVSKSRTALVFLNQLRLKIGVMFGNPETTTGGQALKFYASVRLDIRRVDSIKSGTDVTGSRARVKVVKNKIAPPFKQAEFDIMYNEGISREGNILDVAVDKNIVRKSGAFYYLGDERIGQGRENAKSFLKQHPELTDEIANLIRAQMDTTPVIAGANVDSDDEEGSVFEEA